MLEDSESWQWGLHLITHQTISLTGLICCLLVRYSPLLSVTDGLNTAADASANQKHTK